LVVDGHAYAYRSYHAISSLTAPDGAPTNAIYGFIKTLDKLRETLQPDLVAVVWDGGLASERLAALPAYKSQRPPMPENLRAQLDGINAWLDASGLAWLLREAVEADDWIATLTRRALEHEVEVVIASSDKDFMQLASPRVGLLNPNDKSATIGREEQVRNKTGVAPSQVVDWLSLVGDSVDNIPGVPGVGPKTAAELLHQFGSVDALYARLDEVRSERLRCALRASHADVRRNQQLIRLRDDLPLDLPIEHWRPRPADPQRQKDLCQRWGFKSWLAQTESAEARQPALL
jgi:DNA polymerase I